MSYVSFIPRSAALAVCTLTLTALAVSAQEEKVKFPQASQHAVVKQRVGLTDVEIDYSRPNKNNREIFGGLVPWEKVWRTGANDPTKLKVSDAVQLEGKEIPAGEYAVYTIPTANEWTVIISKNTKLWGAYGYKPDADLVRFTVKPATVPDVTESFTIGFENLKSDTATLFLEWDKTHVPIKLTTNTTAQVSQAIEKTIQGGKEQDAGFYYNAGSFYFEQNKDLEQAAKWVDKATEMNPKAYYMFTKKAQILAKLGKKSEAIAAAEKSNEILKAQPEPDESAMRNNQLLIDSLR